MGAIEAEALDMLFTLWREGYLINLFLTCEPRRFAVLLTSPKRDGRTRSVSGATPDEALENLYRVWEGAP
jgi:hypothetical protein